MIRSAIDRLSRALTILAIVAAGLMMLHVSADVFSKLVFRYPLFGTLETVSLYYMVAVVFLPLALAQRDRSQVFIELFTHRLPERAQRALDAFALLLGFAFTAILFWKGFEVAVEKTQVRELSTNIELQYEVWPGRWFPVAGFGLTAAWCLLQFVDEVRIAIRGESDGRAGADG